MVVKGGQLPLLLHETFVTRSFCDFAYFMTLYSGILLKFSILNNFNSAFLSNTIYLFSNATLTCPRV